MVSIKFCIFAAKKKWFTLYQSEISILYIGKPPCEVSACFFRPLQRFYFENLEICEEWVIFAPILFILIENINMFTPNKSDKLIFVNIKNSYEALQRNDTSNPLYRDSLYECTVKFWRIAEEKATSATHILGCYKGKVIEVVKINGVSSSISGKYIGRKIFDGDEQRNSEYLGFDLHEIFDTLANFNTKYWNL